jgi:hypothetical protein
MNIKRPDGTEYFNNPSILFKKCQYDYSRIKSNQHSEDLMIYAIIDTIITINNLFEWAMNSDIHRDKKARCFKLFNPYENKKQAKKYYEYFSPIFHTNDDQCIIRGLSNNFKHYEIKKLDMSECKVNVAQAGMTYAGQRIAVAGYYELSFVVTDLRTDKKYNILEIIQNSLSQWDDFLSSITGEVFNNS